MVQKVDVAVAYVHYKFVIPTGFTIVSTNKCLFNNHVPAFNFHNNFVI